MAKQAYIAVDADCETQFPIFGYLKAIFMVNDKIYLNYRPLRTLCFNPDLLSYEVEEFISVADNTPSEFVDFNIYHLIESKNKKLFITVKYKLSDIITRHLECTNPLHNI